MAGDADCSASSSGRFSAAAAASARKATHGGTLLQPLPTCHAILPLPPTFTLVFSALCALPAGYQYGPPAVYAAPSRRPGLGPAGAGMLGAGAGLLGGVLLADAMTPDVVQQTTVVEDGGGAGDADFSDFGGGGFGGDFSGGGFGDF